MVYGNYTDVDVKGRQVEILELMKDGATRTREEIHRGCNGNRRRVTQVALVSLVSEGYLEQRMEGRGWKFKAIRPLRLT